MNLRWTEPRKLAVLDFDLENRPLSYAGPDWTTAEITAIAFSWVGEEAVRCYLLGRDDPRTMLREFVSRYEAADMVTGHYIRKHDLPIINGALLEYGLAPLGQKLTSDTKLDLVKKKDMSASQKSLAEMYGLPEGKYDMSQPKWREANRLTPEGIEQTRRRVVDDVIQHKALRERLLEANALKSPRLWRP